MKRQSTREEWDGCSYVKEGKGGKEEDVCFLPVFFLFRGKSEKQMDAGDKLAVIEGARRVVLVVVVVVKKKR